MIRCWSTWPRRARSLRNLASWASTLSRNLRTRSASLLALASLTAWTPSCTCLNIRTTERTTECNVSGIVATLREHNWTVGTERLCLGSVLFLDTTIILQQLLQLPFAIKEHFVTDCNQLRIWLLILVRFHRQAPLETIKPMKITVGNNLKLPTFSIREIFFPSSSF